jgi:hypothetical protein
MKGFVADIEELTEDNGDFRRALHRQQPPAGVDPIAATGREHA